MRREKSKLLFVCAIVLLLGVAPVAQADWNEGDGHKMHYPQLPKPGGWDVSFDPAVRLADDWECSETGPVEDIHFWVSWKYDDVQPINGFSVRIWSDNPSGPSDYSEPNELLWERDFDAGDFTVHDMPPDLQSWFDPWLGDYILNDHTIWQQINIVDINDPFPQKEGEIYWLEIDMWGATDCGWKESGSPHFRDDAVYWGSSKWNEVRDPITEESMDLAFVITGEQEPEPGIKWQQLPDPDETGYHAHDGLHIADDWLCEGGLVTDLHWWGNNEDDVYNNWGFEVSIYADAGGIPDVISGPLWAVTAPLGPGPGEIHRTDSGLITPMGTIWYYEFDLLDPFPQLVGQIYWLDLSAISEDPLMPPMWHWQGNNDPLILNDPVQWDFFGYMSPLEINMAFEITSGGEEPEPGIKWEQLPDLNDTGIDVDITYCGPAGDDFKCTTSGPILDVHIWGSWLYDNLPFGDPTAMDFIVQIWSDNPMGPMGYSEPDELLWERWFSPGDFDVSLYAQDLYEGYYLPCEEYYYPQGDTMCWQYDFYIDPCEAFMQEGTMDGPVTYWLVVQALPHDEVSFGWKTSLDKWNDDGVWGFWEELRYPIGHPFEMQSMDLAFRITGEEEEPEPGIKWEQLPDLDETGVDVDITYCGPAGDDFECTTSGPILDVHIWGSWLFDGLPFMPPGDPTAMDFLLQIYSDNPMGPMGYSEPNELLWEWWFFQGDFNASIYASNLSEWYYIPCSGEYGPDADWTCWQYDFYIDPCEAFMQEGTMDEPVTYWLVVQAIPYDEVSFGWKTSLDKWNDDGVWGDGMMFWEELRYPPGHPFEMQSMDLAFMITGEEEEPELDFGDANDPTYPTLLASDGARHIIAGPWMGDITDVPDAEPDGQPTPAATGDDLDGNDDEDGLPLPTLTTGQSVTFNLEVNNAPAPGGAVVQIWIDYNQSGNWEHPAELAYSALLPNGINPIIINVPAAAVPGMTFARARISTAGGLTPTGQASDGEVEDTEVEIKEPPPPPDLDFGDAPDPTYPTLLINGGANHIIVPGVYLGQQIDAELDGQPTLAADGDDNNNLDDEDGVTFLSPIIPGTTVDVNVVASANGFLFAWFDLNADGDWDEAGENIFAGQALNAGGNALQFNIPMTAPVGKTTYSRWRFVRTSAVGVSYRGQALDGEVEDYIHEIKEPPPKPLIKHSKWSQPPIELDPNSDIPVFCGWDELSLREWVEPIWFDCWDCPTQCYGDADCDGDVGPQDLIILNNAWPPLYPYNPCADFDRNLVIGASDLSILMLNWDTYPPPDCAQRPQSWRIAADDFRCLGNMPITSIHFWGSHYGWEQEEPGTTQPVPPIAWRIGFWSNVPAQGGTGTDECTWNPGDPYKMHYPQEPKPGGWNVAFNNSRLADDWKCSETGPVSDIHFWVSWKGDNVQPIPGFSVRIHSDIPAVDSPTGYSIPAGDFLWERDFYPGDFTVRDMHPDWQGWLDPYSGEIYPDDHTAWQQIDICKILDPFHQEEGTIYWLEIDFGPLPDIGWKESGSVHFNDDAVRWESPQWMELRDPFTEESLDLAFVITTEKYSHPEKLLWQIEVDADRVEIEEVGTDDFHHYHPNDICYQYNLTLEPNEYFWQGKYLERTEDSVFWLSIAAIYPEGVDLIYPWGWKTRPWHWMDDAVRIWHEGPLEPNTVLDPYSMEPIKDPRDPEFGKSFDLAFELDTDPNYIKWEQHYTGIRHWPHYEDEESFATEETFMDYKWLQRPDTSPEGMDVDATDDIWRPQLLADDFPCEMTGPIDRIHIWGSWFHDRKPFDNDANMVAFTLSIHADIPDPDGKGPLYSMPGQLLWRRDFYPSDFQVFLYEWINEGWFVPCAEPPLYDPYADNECWMYMFPIPPTEAFWQEQGNIYWLDVQAKPMLDPMIPRELVTRFGWKNTNPMNHFSDDAVWAVGTEEDGSGIPTHGPWNEMRYPAGHPWEGQSVDMAFEIFTYGTTKWAQPPEFTDINSIDIDATRDEIWQPQLLADDFNCTTTEPITDIHVWGSWYHDLLPYGDPGMVTFKLSIHKDIPEDESPTGYSIPGDLLWEKEFRPGEFDVNIFAEDLDEGYYVPCSEPPYYERIGDHICWQYDFYLNESEAFVQEGTEDEPVVYWLNVQAVPLTPPDQPIEPMRPRFGWKTTDPGSHWNDDAVWAVGTEQEHSEWQELRHPETGETLDLAFAITTSEKELITHRQVADDWKCERHTPVTAAVWWGSYLGFEYWACHGQQMPPPEKPDYFLLSIWTDVPDPNPADPSTFSHPNDIIWEYKAYDYDEVLVGYDKHPHDPAGGATGPPREPVFRYSVQLPRDEWFRQKDVNGIYWFSTVAVYEKPLAEIEHPWGWTNHEHVFNDDAAAWEMDTSGLWNWVPLKDQTGKTEDMSFILYTEPGCFPSWYTTYFTWLARGKPNCWCGIYGTPPWPYQCDADTDGLAQWGIYRVFTDDLAVLAANWKKLHGDPTLNACADIDHKNQWGIYAVFTDDLAIMATHWKKLDAQLPANCPRPE